MDSVIEVLLHHRECNLFGQSPLHIVVRLADFGLAHALIRKGTKINALDIFGNTPLSLACIEKPNKKMVLLLLQHGANINLERNLHMNLFLECVLNCSSEPQLEIISILIDKGINVNVTDKISNRNCMHLVAITGYIPLVRFLLEHGAILNIKDNFHTTPTFLAEIHENYEVMKMFDLHLKKFNKS